MATDPESTGTSACGCSGCTGSAWQAGLDVTTKTARRVPVGDADVTPIMISDVTEHYSEYKDAGILGRIPAHWHAQQLGRLGRLFKGNGGTKVDEVPEGIPCIRYGDIYTQYDFFARGTRSFIAAERACDYTPILYGDVLFAASGETMEEIGKSVANLMGARACCGGDVIVFRPSIEADPRYLGYAADCATSRFQKSRMGHGMTVMHIYGGQLKRLWLAVPPRDEQQFIADFVDGETERIDTLMAKKQRLVKLLHEQRTTLISQAVTKGLDRDAPMKNSGVEWLDEIPSHWSVSPLMRLCDPSRPIIYGIVLPGPHFPGGVPIVKGGDVTPQGIRRDLLKCTDPAIEMQHARSRLRGGEILYAIRGSIGAAEIAPADFAGANITQDVARIAPINEIDAPWLLYVLQSQPVFGQLEAGAVGATIGASTSSVSGGQLSPVPPPAEQAAIRRRLDRQTQAVREV